MNKEELTKYLNGLNDCWQFLKFGMTSPDKSSRAFWADAIEKAGEIDKKHNNPVIRAVLIAAADEIERVGRRAECR